MNLQLWWKSSLDKCHLCDEVDTIEHFFSQCTYNELFWQDVSKLITSLAKEVMFLVALHMVCLFVCLSVCEQHYSKSYKRIGMKFYGGVLGSTRKN